MSNNRIRITILFFLLAMHTATAQPLTVGDRSPDFLLTPIGGKQPLKLSGFKNKLVLLQLWSPFCHASVNTFPLLDSLQQAFPDKLQVVFVTAESQKRVEAALETFQLQPRSWWPYITGDSVITAAFPHLAVPHIIWIDTAGIIRAITGAEYLRPENIEAVYRGREVRWPVKKEVAAYDYSRPLLQPADNGAVPISKLFYGAVAGYLDGVPRKIVRDTVDGRQRLSLLNFSIVELYKNALKTRPHLRAANRFFLEVKDSARFLFTGGAAYRAEWVREQFYCYEAVHPLELSEAKQWDMMRHDLDRFFGLESRIEKRRMTCLVLKEQKKGAGKAGIGNSKNGEATTTFATLRFRLAADPGLPPFINETGLSPATNLPFRSSLMDDLPALKKELKTCGLLLQEEQKEIEVFRLIEK